MLALRYEALALGDPGQTAVVRHPEPGSPDEQALSLLAGLAASADERHAGTLRSRPADPRTS